MPNPLLQDEYKISAHRLNLFRECRFKLVAYLRHWDADPADQTYISAGNAVHNYMEDLIAGNPKDIEDYIVKYNVPDKTKERVRNAVKHAQKYASMKGETEVTKHTHFVTPKGRKVDLETRIDFLTEDAVYDWKTSAKLGSDEYTRQMHTYIFAEDFTKPAILVSLLDGSERRLDESPKDFIPALCDEYIDCLEELDFPRSPNRFCSSCEYKRYCQDEDMMIKDIPYYAKGDDEDESD